jgi:hypothetical protein
MVAAREILNFQNVEKQFQRRDRNKPVRIHSDMLEIDEVIHSMSFDSLKKDLLEMAEKFPYRRVALTCRRDNEEFILEIHPVTGAA